MKSNIQKFPNGLTIITYPTKVKHMFFFQLIVKAGTLQQRHDHIGYAHFLEHLMSFYPSEKYPDALYNQNKINELGIDMNAWTDDDNCGYYMMGLESHSEFMLDLLFNVLYKPLWKTENVQALDSIFEQERGAVIRELSNYIDDPWYAMNTQMHEILYRGTNMEKSIKTERENVKRLNIKTFSQFYDTFYKPENMVLSIITNNSSIKLLKTIKTNYNDFLNQPKSKSTKIVMPVPKPLSPNVYFNHSPKTDEYRIVFIIRLPKFTFFDLKEAIILDMISSILTKGLSSRLYTELRSRLGAVYNVTSEINLDHRCGEYSYFCIETKTQELFVKRVIETIEANLNAFYEPTEEEIHQIQNETELQFRDKQGSTTFKKEFEECNEYLTWNQKCITLEQKYKMRKQILKQLHNVLIPFVNQYFRHNYYVFYSGKKRMVRYSF